MQAPRQHDTRSLHPSGFDREHQGGDGCVPRDGQPTSAATYANLPTVEDVIGFDALWDSMMACKRGVVWKDSVAHFVLNGAEEIAKLSQELHDGTYRPRPTRTFRVTSPKPREIVSVGFRDRVFQRSLNDNVVYPLMSRRWVYDNAACQRGKGTDFARERLKCHVQRLYRRHGTALHVLQVDVRGYYPNMRHDVAKAAFRRDLPDWAYDMVESILDQQYPGDVGFNPGSQLVQIAGIAVLDPIDHLVKERLCIKAYVRYMDDMILVHESAEHLERCREDIESALSGIGLEVNQKKTRIYPISEGIPFLGFRFALTGTGKVVMLVCPSNVKQARRRTKRFASLVLKGRRSREQADSCFASYIAHASNGDSRKLVARLERWYRNLWTEDQK